GQQERDDLHRLAARVAQPRVILALVELFHPLELEISLRIAFVRRPDAIGERGHAARVEHLHRHRRARPRQAGDDDDGRADAEAADELRDRGHAADGVRVNVAFMSRGIDYNAIEIPMPIRRRRPADAVIRRAILLAALAIVLAPAHAYAYIGPGAGF